MSILGIDFGDKKVGVARAAEGSSLAVPLTVLQNRGRPGLLDELAALCEQEEATAVVVGVPISLSGRGDVKLRPQDYGNEQMRKVLTFIEALGKRLPIPVVPQDERLSTREAIHLSADKRQGQPEDAVAAMIILQGYLDRSQRKT